MRPRLVAIKVSGCHLILVICVWGELADLEEVQAERLDLGQHAVQRGPVQQAGEHGVRAVLLRGQAGKADSTVAPRWPLIRITYRADAGSMRPWSRAGR